MGLLRPFNKHEIFLFFFREVRSSYYWPLLSRPLQWQRGSHRRRSPSRRRKILRVLTSLFLFNKKWQTFLKKLTFPVFLTARNSFSRRHSSRLATKNCICCTRSLSNNPLFLSLEMTWLGYSHAQPSDAPRIVTWGARHDALPAQVVAILLFQRGSCTLKLIFFFWKWPDANLLLFLLAIKKTQSCLSCHPFAFKK